MKSATMVTLLSAALLAACAPAAFTTDDARAAMTARMERPGANAVKVQQIHTLELSECTDTVASGTVTCTVAMDVSFETGGVTHRDADTAPIRFVREGSQWTAQPLP